MNEREKIVGKSLHGSNAMASSKEGSTIKTARTKPRRSKSRALNRAVQNRAN